MSVELIAKPHPLRSDLYTCELEPGRTIADAVGEHPGHVCALVNGEPWGVERWNDPLPAGCQVNVIAVPQDDEVMRVVATIAVTVAAVFTGGLAAGAMGLVKGTFAYTAVSAGVGAVVSVAGSLAVNALIPPKLPDAPGAGSSGSSTVRNSITGTRNQANLYGVIPRVYGNPRWYPPLAAQPITEVVGNDQYLRMLLCLGYGPLRIGGHGAEHIADHGNKLTHETSMAPGTIRIGETDIGEFEDIEFEIGYAEDIELYSQNVEEEALGVALNMVEDPDNRRVAEYLFDYELNESWTWDDGNSATRTTAPETQEISVDLVAPQGLFNIDKDVGTKRPVVIWFRIEYRPTSGGAWQTAFEPEIRGGSGSDSTVRKNYRWLVPVGQYDVRITRERTQLYGKTSTAVVDFTWTTLRSIQKPEKPYLGDHLLMSLRIRATDQLNNAIDQLSIRSESVLRVWDGEGFTLQPTSNPAWAYLDSLTGQQIARPVGDSRVDIDSLHDWAMWCQQQGLEYHHVHDAPETLFDRARAISSAGQASFSLQDGLFGVVRDDPQAPTVQMISPRNASGFESSRQYKALPHALRVKYIDPDSWTDSERIIYRDGYDESSATEFEDFETQGVASAEEAWHHGQYYFRQAILRPETYKAEMDWEHLACVRGNRVRLAYDTILVGMAWGRIKSVTLDGENRAVALTLDEEVPDGANSIRIRKQDGGQQVATFTLNGDELDLLSPVEGVSAGDLVLLGQYGEESLDCKITRIEPGADFTASLTLVDAATDIYDFGSPPSYDPGITVPSSTLRAPAELLITTGLEEYVVTSEGTIRSRARVTWAPVTGATEYELVYRRAEPDAWTTLRTSQQAVYIEPVYNGETLEVRVRARDQFGRESKWTDGSHNVVAATAHGEVVRLPIPNMSGLELFEQGNDTVFGGRDAKFVWRGNTVTQWRDLGWEINGAGDGALDPYFADYQVEIWAEVGGLMRLVRTEWVNDPQWVYTGEKNAEDHARETGAPGAWRAFEFRGYCRGRQNQISERPARLAVSNPPPALPDAITITPSLRSVAVEFKAPEDLDYRHTRVWLSAASGFTPDDDTLAAQVDGSVAIQGLTDGTTYYIRIASYDAFGQGEMSPEFSVTTQTIGTGDVEGLQDEIGDLQDAIGDKGDILFQATEPGPAYQNENTLWVDTSLDTNDNPKNTPKRWDGSAWVAVSDQEIKDAAAEAYQAAQDAQDLAEGKSRVLVQSTAPAAEYENDKTLWIDTTNGANTPKHWDGTEWASIQDGDIAQAKTDISDIKVKKTIRMDANGNITGVENIDGTEAGQFNILSDNFNIVDPGDPGGTPLVPFTVTGGTVYANNLMITQINLEDGSIDLAGPAITGQLAGDNIQDGAIVNVTETTASPNTQIFDGSEAGQWVECAAIDVSVLGDGSAVAVQMNFALNLDQVSETATQVGPGGPTVQMRLLRDGVIVWQPDPIMASGSGYISLQFGSKIDTGATSGPSRYSVEIRWDPGYYDAGTLSYDVQYDANGEARVTADGIAFVGGFPATYLGADWNLHIPSASNNPIPIGYSLLPITRLKDSHTLHTDPDNADIEIRLELLDDAGKANTTESFTGVAYHADSDSHKMVGTSISYWIRCLEYRG